IEQINSWVQHNCLQLNRDKTDIIVFGTRKERQSGSAYRDSLAFITKSQVRNLGAILDPDLNFYSHIKSVTSSAHYHLKNIKRVRGLMYEQDLERLTYAFISSRLDYWSSATSAYSGRCS
ncbi:hypothetical protein LDENG_00200810, partial [Lucifuga dentata]